MATRTAARTSENTGPLRYIAVLSQLEGGFFMLSNDTLKEVRHPSPSRGLRAYHHPAVGRRYGPFIRPPTGGGREIPGAFSLCVSVCRTQRS
jgi:hypothetical protein